MTHENQRTISFVFRPSADEHDLNVGRVPRIVRLMALALHFEDLLRTGNVRNYADLARLGQVTRGRMTQIMNLLNLAPDIQEALLFSSVEASRFEAFNERSLRFVTREPLWPKQREQFTFRFERKRV